jgi:hypothetical protein
MDLQEMDCVRGWVGEMYWIELGHGMVRCRALMNAVMNFLGSIKFGEFLLTSCEPVSFS